MVHQYKSNGYNIVLDVNSGCVHVVDDLAYDVIGLWEKSEPQEIVAAMLENMPISRKSRRKRSSR